jgi:hypothetical protein
MSGRFTSSRMQDRVRASAVASDESSRRLLLPGRTDRLVRIATAEKPILAAAQALLRSMTEKSGNLIGIGSRRSRSRSCSS